MNGFFGTGQTSPSANGFADQRNARRLLSFATSFALVLSLSVMSGCNVQPTTGDSSGGGTSTGADTDGQNSLNSDALSFEGSLSGKLVDTQSTRSDTNEAAQELPPSFETDNTCVRFKDLAGENLVDPNGEPIAEVEVQSDGSFNADNLPVGTDFTVCGDIGKDGSCDIESCVNIPADENGTAGTLNDVQVDPLTTIVLAKLRELIDESGIDPAELPVSPATIVARIVDAFENLFEDAGIEQIIELSTILEETNRGSLFDELVPAGARTGLEMVEGNLGAAVATDANELTLAVAEVFLRAGFPVADFPGGPDLSTLGTIDGVTTTTPQELFNEFAGEFDEFGGEADFLDELPEELLGQLEPFFPDGLPEDLINEDGTLSGDLPEELPTDLEFLLEEFAGDFNLEPANAEVIYISDFSEPDRNFPSDDVFEEGDGLPPLPIINDNILNRMAALHLQGRVITLDNLFELLTDVTAGMGLRLTYFVEDPHFGGQPLVVFQTEDGQGKAINIDQMFERVFETERSTSFLDDEETFVTNIRSILADTLSDTLPPSFDQVFNGVAVGRVAGVEDVANHIRGARAHLPFSRTGPSTLFVVADSDGFFDGDNSSAITVDADVDIEGNVSNVSFNSNGQGEFWLGFTHLTETDGIVELIVAETGRPLHSKRGPAFISMFDESLFGDINGNPFFDFVSESGTFYPSVPVTIFAEDFAPEFIEGDVIEEGPDFHDQVWVLAKNDDGGNEFEPEAIRVDYDPATSTATFNPFGRYLLAFEPDSHETGVFKLFNEQTGRFANFNNDPDVFFEDVIEQPDDFFDFFNENNLEEDGFDDFGVIDEFINELPPPNGDDPFNPNQTDGDGPNGPNPDGTDPNGGDPNNDGPNGDDPNAGIDDPAPASFVDDAGFIFVDIAEIFGVEIFADDFAMVFGKEVPNPRYNPDGDPYFDDVNGNGVQDQGEPTSDYRPTLFEPNDWRSTDVRVFYRQADGQPVTIDNVDWESETPQTLDGVELVARNYLPRLNAFRFGRPNTAINMLSAFLPPDFFNGTNVIDGDTEVDIFSAIAMINLVMDQVFNIEGNIDPDGFGPLPRELQVINADPFIVPVDDPFVLIARGFESRTSVRTETAE
ncbi:MAG: hypothetical protein ACPGXK_04420 [Phycisphaerae bacterium]